MPPEPAITLGHVRSNPAIDAALRNRLREAVEQFAGGNAEAFGKMLGFANGGYIRQCLRPNDPRPVRSSLIGRVNDHPLMQGWFDGLMPPIVAADVRPRPAGQVNMQWPQAGHPRDQASAWHSAASAFTLPPRLSWEQLMQSQELPPLFVLVTPDDALAPNLTRGTPVVFERGVRAEPGDCILVRTAAGQRYMRRLVQGRGENWVAQALDPAYVTLTRDEDGLEIEAVMAWRAERRV